jgi:hypothetical protein
MVYKKQDEKTEERKETIMKYKTITALAIVMMATSSTVATMRPTILKKGQFGFGVNYSRLRVDETKSRTEFATTLTAKSVKYGFKKKQEMTFRTVGELIDDTLELESGSVELSYGLFDYWKISVGIGAAELDREGDASNYTFGSSFTFYADNKWELGIAGLYSTYSYKNGISATENICWGNSSSPIQLSGDWEADINILIFGGGVTYNVNDWLKFYGGPFIQKIDGNLKSRVSGSTKAPRGKMTMSMETTMKASISSLEPGGYIGFIIGDISDTFTISVEYQKTETSRRFSAGFFLPF